MTEKYWRFEGDGFFAMLYACGEEGGTVQRSDETGLRRRLQRTKQPTPEPSDQPTHPSEYIQPTQQPSEQCCKRPPIQPVPRKFPAPLSFLYTILFSTPIQPSIQPVPWRGGGRPLESPLQHWSRLTKREFGAANNSKKFF